MEYMDLDSFRSKYSDLTVTAVPAKRRKLDTQPAIDALVAAKEGEVTSAARVEITPVAAFQPRSKAMQQQQPKIMQSSAAYSNEYQQVLAKLEYTKYVQAQLQLMSSSNGIGANSADAKATSNIVEIYGNLLGVIAEMQSNLKPTAMGLRAPKERLLRDIAHARVLVRESVLMLMRNQQSDVSK